jgi:enoyl-[acyl-carrier protein] reductase/trans-2-enoyl-CoA reductase (NAD+)
MGGEDWKMWMDAKGRKSTSSGATTVAYSYIPSLTEAVYRKGTIGRAKMISYCFHHH